MRILHFCYFCIYYLWRLLQANIRIVWEVLTPRHKMKPAIIAVDILVESDHEILAVANLISMTPGTLTLDISPDKKTLYIHSMYAEDEEDFKRSINTLEKKVHRLLR